MKYICLRCGYDAKQKINLESHLNRKNICEPIDDFISIYEVKKYYGFDKNHKNDSKMNPNNPKLTPNEPKLNPNDPKLNPNDPITECSTEPTLNPFEHSTEPKLNPFEPKNCSTDDIQKKSNQSTKYICEFCNKSYSTNSHMRRHQKTCKKNISSAMEIEFLKENQKKMEIEYNKLQQTVENLKVISNDNISNSNNTTNNNTTNNNTNSHNDNSTHNTININNYGSENKDYITKDYLIKLLKEPFQAIPRLIEYTHFNKDHPENQNIKLPNKKQPYVKVLKDDKWIYADRKSTILDLIDEKHSELNDLPLVKYVEDKFSEHLQDRFERFNDRYLNEEKEFTKQLYNETELVMINNN